MYIRWLKTAAPRQEERWDYRGAWLIRSSPPLGP